MVPREVIAYVQRLRASGYSSQSIRQNLVASGYSPQDADQALLAVYRPNVMIQGRNWKPLAAGLGAGVFVIALLFAFLIPSTPSFTVKTSPSAIEARAGSTLSFSGNLVYERALDSKELELVHELVSPATGNMLLSVDQRVPVSTKTTSRLELPSDLQPGRYVVHTVVTADGATAESSFSFRVLPAKTSVPNAQIIDVPIVENGIVIQPTQDCNDFDPCTEDSFKDGACAFEQLSVCCGDYDCNSALGETTSTCPRDCAAQPAAKSTADIIAEAEQTAASNPERAEILCGTLAVTSDADQCYDSVARISSKSSVCKEIKESKTRDKCILYFAINKDEYEGCAIIDDPNLQSSCYSFKNLKEIQQTVSTA